MILPWKHLLVIQALLAPTTAQMSLRPFSRAECRNLASNENCLMEEMQRFCQEACMNHHNIEVLKQNRIPMEPTIRSFFDLSALDIHGNLVEFGQFRRKVVLITNVASFSDLTTKHYQEMIDLYSKFQSRGFEIIVFPCSQFGAQEPYSNSKILSFCKSLGVDFRIMSKIDVNGLGQHKVYRFLKERVGLDEIKWNFGSYFLINGEGRVKVFNGGSPMILESYIKESLDFADDSN